MYVFDLLLLLFQQMCIYLIIAWMLSKTPLIIPLLKVTILILHKLMCYVIFSAFSIMGSYLGLYIDNSIANTRAIGTSIKWFPRRFQRGNIGRLYRRNTPLFTRRHNYI